MLSHIARAHPSLSLLLPGPYKTKHNINLINLSKLLKEFDKRLFVSLVLCVFAVLVFYLVYLILDWFSSVSSQYKVSVFVLLLAICFFFG